MKSTAYSYIIIKENNPIWERETVLTHNKYNPKKKYVFINKISNKDGSEAIAFIEYSNDIIELQKKASSFDSWYNYPLNLYKNMQGYIREIN